MIVECMYVCMCMYVGVWGVYIYCRIHTCMYVYVCMWGKGWGGVYLYCRIHTIRVVYILQNIEYIHVF